MNENTSKSERKLTEVEQLESWAEECIGWKGPLKQQPIMHYKFSKEELEKYKQAVRAQANESGRAKASEVRFDALVSGTKIVEQRLVWNEEMKYYIPVLIDENGKKYSFSYQPTGSCWVAGFIEIE